MQKQICLLSDEPLSCTVLSNAIAINSQQYQYRYPAVTRTSINQLPTEFNVLQLRTNNNNNIGLL